MRSFLDDGRIEFRPAKAAPGRGPRGDASIRAAILEEIGQLPWLDFRRIAVRVDRGEVALEGEVAERGLRFALREIAARCEGVRAVHDRLRIARSARRL
jgi:osmotically-inducible protein OsmY